MSTSIGITLLLIGFALVFVGRERPDGSSLLQLPDWMMLTFPALCLGLLAFGTAILLIGR
jgi:hypothetical protein